MELVANQASYSPSLCLNRKTGDGNLRNAIHTVLVADGSRHQIVGAHGGNSLGDGVGSVHKHHGLEGAELGNDLAHRDGVSRRNSGRHLDNRRVEVRV